MSYYDVGCGIFNLAHFLMYHNSLIFEGCYWFANDIIKYILPVGSMIKFWVTTFWFMKVAWLWCFMFPRNQKVVIYNSIIEPTGESVFKYFSSGLVIITWHVLLFRKKKFLKISINLRIKWGYFGLVWCLPWALFGAIL